MAVRRPAPRAASYPLGRESFSSEPAFRRRSVGGGPTVTPLLIGPLPTANPRGRMGNSGASTARSLKAGARIAIPRDRHTPPHFARQFSHNLVLELYHLPDLEEARPQMWTDPRDHSENSPANCLIVLLPLASRTNNAKICCIAQTDVAAQQRIDSNSGQASCRREGDCPWPLLKL